MYNLSITGAIRNNFYIPATPDNVEILRVYNEKGEEIKGTLVLYREHDGTPIYYTMSSSSLSRSIYLRRGVRLASQYSSPPHTAV